ncbi:unnamed protein product [Lathyrus sativus]|nr:unnamed protein product [Lathyrus sativus]
MEVGSKIASFFFTEFLDDHEARETFDIFKEYYLVLEVIIPSKRDKRGKIFSFVRFRNIEDSRMMAIKLDNIMINGRKVHANIPWFQRRNAWSRNDKNFQPSKNMVNSDNKNNRHMGDMSRQNIRPDVSFAQVVGGGRKGKQNNLEWKTYESKENYLNAKPSFAHLIF